MKKHLLFLFSILFFVGCGSALDDQKSDLSKDESQQDTSSTVSDKATRINGYVSPINIMVDGVSYVDSEDFYTQEVDRLAEKVREQYPEHKLYFDAEVGLRDLKRDLSVFLVATNEGLADETVVNGKGQFSFELPSKSDLKQTYLLRAYKRIGLRLQKDKETISWCYNLSAEKEVMIEADKSLILREFSTKLTKYQCNTKKDSGISLPYPDMPGVPVKEAFEESETWPGYGPMPKPKTSTEVPIVAPKEPAPSPSPVASQENSEES
jgi:hypothetical protein